MTAVNASVAPTSAPRRRRWLSVGAVVVAGHILLALFVPLLPLRPCL